MSRPPPRAVQVARLLLALVAPLLVLLPAWSVLATRPPWQPSAEVVAMNKEAAAGPADIVVVGPSFARTDLDVAALGAALAPANQTRPLRVARFAQNIASAPTWYAILKERVYGNGLRPRLVLLFATADYLLEVRPPPSRRAGLEQHFAEPDEVIRALTWNTHLPAPLQRALDQRQLLRDPAVALFRDTLVNGAFGGDDEGGDLAAEAGVAVFGQEHGGGTSRLLPVVEAREAAEEEEGLAASGAESYLPPIAAMVAKAGGRLVVVLPPVGPAEAAGHAVPAAVERDIVETTNALGVGLLDLRGLNLSDLDYPDGYHMRPEARQAFTQELAAALVKLGAMGTGPMLSSWVPPTFTVARGGTPPALTLGAPEPGDEPCELTAAFPEWAAVADDRLRLVSGHLPAPFVLREPAGELEHLRRAPGPCNGAWIYNNDRIHVSTREPGSRVLNVEWNTALPARDADGEAAWWVFPEGTLTFSWAEGLAAGPLSADLVILDPTGTATVGVEFGGLPAVSPPAGTIRPLHFDLPAAAESVHLRISTTHAVVVRELKLTIAGREVIVVRPPSPRLVDFLPAEIEAPPPPSLPSPSLRLVRGRAALAAPFEDRLGCSPVRVTENGVLLPSGASAVATTTRPMGKVVDHVDGNVFVVTPDGSEPMKNGRDYRLVYTDERACRSTLRRAMVSRAWVHDGETLRSSVQPTPPLGRDGPIRALAVRAETNAIPASGATATFTLRVGTEVRLHLTVPLAGLEDGADLPLSVPITRRDREGAVLEVSVSGAGTPVLVSAVGMES